MDSKEFRKWGYECIEWAANYMETLESRDPLPHCEPGYLAKIVPKDPPEQPEDFSKIMKDIEPCIMKGMSHWQHPKFFAYFPSGNSYPSILGDLLSNGTGVDCATWEDCPVGTELEIIVMDWCAKFLGLPKFFLSKFSNPKSKGGGTIQTSASEAILLSLIVAREQAVRKLQKVYPEKLRAEILQMLTAYCSNQCHSCVEKGAIIAYVKLRQLESDERGKIPGFVLHSAIKKDLANGYFPFFYCSIMGSTGICAFDDLEGVKGLRQYCRRHIMLAKLFENYVRQDPRFEVVAPVRVGLVCFRLKGPNELNERYLDDMNASRKIHMVPSNFKGQYLIRFAPCYEHLTICQIKEAWQICSEFATVVIRIFEEGIDDTTAYSELLKQQARVIKGQHETAINRMQQYKTQVQNSERRRSSGEDYIVSSFKPHEHKSNFQTHISDDEEENKAIRARVKSAQRGREESKDVSKVPATGEMMESVAKNQSSLNPSFGSSSGEISGSKIVGGGSSTAYNATSNTANNRSGRSRKTRKR